MAEVVFTHEAGTRPISLGAIMSREDVVRIAREETGKIFELSSVYWFDTGEVSVKLSPSRGCIDIQKAAKLEVPHAEKAFRELRECWFNSHLRSHPHERDWEDEERDEIRKKQNESLKARYDADTEAIIRGESRPISPRCGADLFRESLKEGIL